MRAAELQSLVNAAASMIDQETADVCGRVLPVLVVFGDPDTATVRMAINVEGAERQRFGAALRKIAEQLEAEG